VPAPATSPAPAASRTGVHIGASSCNASNCHGDANRPRGSSVAGNEYLIWSKQDKHHNSVAALQSPAALRIAKALGLPDAASQKMCLDCHSDYVAADLRGPQYHVEDGVGCEACHGAASGWLGTHISGLPRQTNIANGMYPTDQPVARAERCLDCHFGNADRFVDHRFYSAGHPRLTFELDTFTAIQPAHFTVNERYIQRKGKVSDVQVWAVGQAAALARRMAAISDPKHAPRGLWPEFALLDCQTCHHTFGTIPGGSPGRFKLNDANAVMVKVAAARISPEAVKELSDHLAALQKAMNGSWAAVQSEAAAIQPIAENLRTVFANHNFSKEEIRGIADALIALGNSDKQFSHTEQVAMALRAVAADLLASGDLPPQQSDAINNTLKAVDAVFAGGSAAMRPDASAKALRDLQGAMRR
jgi:hypothetical protein